MHNSFIATVINVNMLINDAITMYLYLNVVPSRAGWSWWAGWKNNELIFLIQEKLIWAAYWFVKNLPQFGFSVLILDQSSKLFWQRLAIFSPTCTRNENKLIEKESAWNKIIKTHTYLCRTSPFQCLFLRPAQLYILHVKRKKLPVINKE